MRIALIVPWTFIHPTSPPFSISFSCSSSSSSSSSSSCSSFFMFSSFLSPGTALVHALMNAIPGGSVDRNHRFGAPSVNSYEPFHTKVDTAGLARRCDYRATLASVSTYCDLEWAGHAGLHDDSSLQQQRQPRRPFCAHRPCPTEDLGSGAVLLLFILILACVV